MEGPEAARVGAVRHGGPAPSVLAGLGARLLPKSHKVIARRRHGQPAHPD
jgi:hypothetical protein